MKVHLACGDVYLTGYVNIDQYGTIAKNPSPRTLDTYYQDRRTGDTQEIIVDKLLRLPAGLSFSDNTVDEFVMISAFEHLEKNDALVLLSKVYRALKVGGQFKFDFPDLKSTILQYEDEEMVRLVYGSHKNDGGYHRWGYTENTIKEYLSQDPWTSIEFKDIVQHEYPMTGVIATK
jgi:predicted SAM-dependent methyltransferase